MAQTAGDEDLFFELQTRGNLVQVQQEQQKHRIEVLDRKIAAAQARIIVLAKGRRDAGGLAMANSRAALLNSSNVKHSQPKTGVQASQESTRATNKVVSRKACCHRIRSASLTQALREHPRWIRHGC